MLPRIFGLFEYSNNWARIILFVFVFAEFPKSEYYSNIRIIDPNTTNNLLIYFKQLYLKYFWFLSPKANFTQLKSIFLYIIWKITNTNMKMMKQWTVQTSSEVYFNSKMPKNPTVLYFIWQDILQILFYPSFPSLY